jgi:hypothetical protein
VDYPAVLGFVREARSQGLKAPVLLMGSSLDLIHLRDLKIHPGYYNPLLSYGEEKAIQDAREAGANGFIMVDLPPEEAVIFRGKCTKAGYVARDTSSQGQGSLSLQRFLRAADRPVDLIVPHPLPLLDRRLLHLCCFQSPSPYICTRLPSERIYRWAPLDLHPTAR